jgi:hypothetical protein
VPSVQCYSGKTSKYTLLVQTLSGMLFTAAQDCAALLNELCSFAPAVKVDAAGGSLCRRTERFDDASLEHFINEGLLQILHGHVILAMEDTVSRALRVLLCCSRSRVVE